VLPAARELGPLAPVLAQAAISEPLARLDAAALALELETLLQELDPPEPLPLNRTDLALPSLSLALDQDPTERFALAGPSAASLSEARASRSPSAEPVQVSPPPSSLRVPEPRAVSEAAPSSTTPPPVPLAGVRRVLPAPEVPSAHTPPPVPLAGVRRVLPAPEVPSAHTPPDRRRHRWLPWLLVLLLLELVAGAGVVAASRLVWNHDTVPRVVGLQVATAEAALRKSGLTPEVSGALYSGSVVRGLVISQLPRSGTREKSASIVKIVISQGRHPTSLPRLAGMNAEKAGAAIRHAHLVPRFVEQYNETVALGTVVSSNVPPGTRMFYGDTVEVVISKGPQPQLIPTDLSGGVLTSTQVNSVLEDLYLTPVDEQEYSTSVPTGYVISTRPAPGQVVPGHSTVRVIVSAGPPFVTIPTLYSDSVAVAEQALSSLGLEWALYGPPNADFVLSQLPAAGTSVRVGTTVSLYLYP
jgi:serine/threonine-protein kinase